MIYSLTNKVLFVHDGPLYKNDRGDYYGVHFNDNIKDRYLHLGKSITCLIRVVERNDNELRNYSKISNINFNVISFPNFKSLKLFLLNYIKVNKIISDTVYSHDIIIIRMPSASGAIALKACKKLGKPYIIEVVGCTFDAYWNYDWRGKIIALYKYLKFRKLLYNNTHIVYVTKMFLQKRYPTKAKTINCSDVQLDHYHMSLLENRITKVSNIKDNDIITLGTVASLDAKYKRQADIIKVIARLKDENILLRYKIVGQGTGKHLINLISKLKVQDRVEVIGPIQHENIFRFYENIDIYIHPSKLEGLCRSVIEAMSMACPVLASNIGGMPELISKDCLFEPGNLFNIIKMIKNINKEWMLIQAKMNYERAKYYHKDVLDKRRLKFYKEFLYDSGIYK